MNDKACPLPRFQYCGRIHDLGFRFVTYKQLREVYGIPYSRVHIDRLIEAENENRRFPNKAGLSKHRVSFHASCVELWIATRKPVKVGNPDNDI